MFELFIMHIKFDLDIRNNNNNDIPLRICFQLTTTRTGHPV